MQNRQEWLKERKTYLGGSDIGAVVGANKYRSALDVYFDKTSDGIVDEMSPAAYWGTRLEKTVAEEYASVTGYSIEAPTGLIRHSQFPYIACNIDYWANDGKHILECKTASFTKASEWGEEGTDKIPESYLLQVAYYAAITGVPRVDIAVLIGGQDFRIYTYKADYDLQRKLIRAAEVFWTKYMQTNTPPKPKTTRDMENLYPKANGLEVRASDVITGKIEQLQDLKAQVKELDNELDALQLDIKEYMQDAEVLIADDGHVLASWKNRKASKKLDTKKLKSEHSDIYEQYLTESKASRVFALKG